MRLNVEGLANIRNLTVVLLVLFLILLSYFNTFSSSFVYDDRSIIVENDFIKSWKNLPRIFSKSYLTDPSDLKYLGVKDIGSGESAYRPVVTLSYFIDYFLWRLNAFGYHLTNIFLHFFNSVLFYFFVFFITKNKKVAMWSSLLFALHPVNTEPVNCISFREDLLAFLFSISSIILFIRLNDYVGKKRFLCYIASLILFLLALFSKEAAIVLPILLILYDYIFVAQGRMRGVALRFRSYAGYILILIFYVYVRFFLFSSDPELYTGYLKLSFYSTILTMSKIIVFYTKWLFLPIDVRLIWKQDDFLVSHSVLTAGTMISIFLVITLLALAVRQMRRNKEISFAIFWFFITLIPVSNIIPLQNFMAARYLYIPAAGFCLLISTVLFNISNLETGFIRKAILRRFSRDAVLVLLIFYAIFSIPRNYYWKNNTLFWMDMAENYPDNSLVHEELARSYLEAGEYDKAIEEFNIAINLIPANFHAHEGLGMCYKKKGMLDEAIEEFKKALELDPARLPFYLNLGNALMQKGLYEQAVEVYEQAIEVDPKYADAYNNLGLVYIMMENRAEAEKMWRRALEIDPEDKIAQGNLELLKD